MRGSLAKRFVCLTLFPALVSVLILLSCLVGLGVNVLGEEPATLASVDGFGTVLFYGPRLHTDAAFYVQAGIRHDDFDVTAGIGFNDGVWFGGHLYSLNALLGDFVYVSVFSGLELYIEWVEERTFEPAFAVGSAFAVGPVHFIVDVLVWPGRLGEPVPLSLAFSINFGKALE